MDDDRSVIDAMSWRLASELLRRHPDQMRLMIGYPGGGQYDVLWLIDIAERFEILLNRNGTIQITGQDLQSRFEPVEWETYMQSDSREFVESIERCVGLTAPPQLAASDERIVTYRVLAAIAAMSIKTVPAVSIEQGYIDTSGYGGGPSKKLAEFRITPELLKVRSTDLLGEPGYRFWVVSIGDGPAITFEESSGKAFMRNGRRSIDVMGRFNANSRHAAATAASLLAASAHA